MSAVGDYIHYYKKNYLNWGIYQINTIRGESKDDSFSNFKASITNANKINSLMTEAKDLELQYNKLFYSNSKDKDYSSFRLALENNIQIALNKQYGLLAGKFNPETLEVDESVLYNQLKNAITATRERIQILTIQKDTTVKELIKKIDSLFLLFEQNEFKNISEIQSELNFIKSKLVNIKNELSLSITKVTGKPLNLLSYSENINFLNSLIIEFNRIPTLYDQNEMIFSWLIPFINLNTSSIAKENLIDMLFNIQNEFNSNNNNSKMNVQLDMKKNKVPDISLSIENVLISTQSSNTTTNINISYTDRNGITQNKIATSKNIPIKDINLLNDKTLYDILNLSNIYNFSNHYLNLITSAGSQTFDSGFILQANRILKSAILNLGIEDFEASGKPDFLIINDSKQKKIHVYSIRALLYIIQEGIISNNGKFSDIVDLEDSYSIKQKWHPENKEGRIEKVLAVTQKKRITSTLKGNNLNKYLSLLKGY